MPSAVGVGCAGTVGGSRRILPGHVGGGNDTLEDGKGNDDFHGGADRFVFDRESKADTIHDFEDGKDTLAKAA